MCSLPPASVTRDAHGEHLLAEILRDLEQAKTSLEGIADTRHLGAIRSKMKKLLLLPGEKMSDADKEAHRLSQQRFYLRNKESILEKKRMKRKRDKQSEDTHP